MCYSLCWSLLASKFPSDFRLILALYAKLPDFYTDIFPLSCTVPVTYVGGFPYIVSVFGHGESARDSQTRRGGQSNAGGEKSYAGVRTKLFWREIYCAKPRTNPESHSGSWYHRGLGRRSHRIMQEYNLTTTIMIRQLIHPHTCKMGSSILSTMSRLKPASTIRASTEIKNRKMCLLIMEVLNSLIIFLIIPKIQELIHWFMLVGVRV